MTQFMLLANNGFTTDDYPQPDDWAGVVRDMGVTWFEYFTDHMEPLMFRRVIRERSEFFQATRDAIQRHGIQVYSAATARVSYLQNMLSHPYEDMRRVGREWGEAMIDLAGALDADHISGHYDCIPIDDAFDRLPACIDRIVDEMVALSAYGAEHGLKAIFLEQMHRRQLQPNTIANGREMIERINARSAIPVHIQLDVGHMAFVKDDPDHGPADKDVYQWLATPFGGNQKLMVHAQQTDAAASRHWPFTPEYNAKGMIDVGRCIEAIERSGVEQAVIVLEILFSRGTRLEPIRRDLVESAECWRRALEAAGYDLQGDAFVKSG